MSCNAGVIAHRVSSDRLGANRASLLGGLILSSGPPLGFQFLQRVEARQGKRLTERVRAEPLRRVGPILCVLLAQVWPLSPTILAAAKSMANWPQEVPPAPDVQVAVFSAYLGRLLSAPGFDNLSIPLGWPSTLALEIDQGELDDIVALASMAGSSSIGF